MHSSSIERRSDPPAQQQLTHNTRVIHHQESDPNMESHHKPIVSAINRGSRSAQRTKRYVPFEPSGRAQVPSPHPRSQSKKKTPPLGWLGAAKGFALSNRRQNQPPVLFPVCLSSFALLPFCSPDLPPIRGPSVPLPGCHVGLPDVTVSLSYSLFFAFLFVSFSPWAAATFCCFSLLPLLGFPNQPWAEWRRRLLVELPMMRKEPGRETLLNSKGGARLN
jgi:hypothetical protein